MDRFINWLDTGPVGEMVSVFCRAIVFTLMIFIFVCGVFGGIIKLYDMVLGL